MAVAFRAPWIHLRDDILFLGTGWKAPSRGLNRVKIRVVVDEGRCWGVGLRLFRGVVLQLRFREQALWIDFAGNIWGMLYYLEAVD